MCLIAFLHCTLWCRPLHHKHYLHALRNLWGIDVKARSPVCSCHPFHRTLQCCPADQAFAPVAHISAKVLSGSWNCAREWLDDLIRVIPTNIHGCSISNMYALYVLENNTQC